MNKLAIMQTLKVCNEYQMWLQYSDETLKANIFLVWLQGIL